MMHRLHRVMDDLYRGSAPTNDDVRWLHDILNINKIVSLDSQASHDIDRICKKLGIEHITIPIEGNSVTQIRQSLLQLASVDLKHVPMLHGCRAIPLAWMVVEGKGLVKVSKLKSMLQKVQRFLKRHVREVLFLADAGFRDCDWAQLCADLGWNYGIRIACNTYLTLPNGTTDRLDWLVPENRNRYFQNALLTKEAKWQANVSVTWTMDKDGKPDMVAVMTNQIACRARLREYAKRISIEMV